MLSCLCCKLLDRCCYWYCAVPGNNSECVVTPGQTAYLRCEVYVPPDVNNNPAGRVKWYKSLDLVTSEDLTDEYDVLVRLAALPVMSGNLIGLFRNTFYLIIHNISSSDNRVITGVKSLRMKHVCLNHPI